jgi:endonuclease/exonuclease/phosphatase family metal-dependent hydrolase
MLAPVTRTAWRFALMAVMGSCAPLPPASAQPVTQLDVMSFNVLVAGQRGLGNIAEAIRRSGADVVGLQEIAGSPAAITQLATNLGFHTLAGLPILSRYPIRRTTLPGTSDVQNGATLELSPGQRVHLFNCHLAPFPYGPYHLRDGQPSNAIISLETTTRLPQITNLLAAMAPYLATDEPCFLTGDFNAPSHLDYAGFPWPVSTAVQAAGLLDSYRLLHPANRSFPPAFAFDEPGITWTPDGAAADDTFDRIDFVYYSPGDGVAPLASSEQDARNNLSPWPSDHRAVLSRFQLTPPVPRAGATRPFPPSGATQVATNVQLSWLPGSNALEHIVHFGTSKPGSLVVTQAVATFDPGPLAPDTTYLWQVDEVNPDGVVAGAAWTFATLNPSASTVYEWTFDHANLAASLGPGVMSYADAATAILTSFGTTDGTSIPHIGGQPAGYLGVPAFTDLANGFHLSFEGSGPNGGGSYLNRFTFVFDVLIPGTPGWTPLFNTNPQNANDADWYVDPTGRLGIGDLGYSSAGVVSANVWQRLASAADLGAGAVAFYVNGSLVRQRAGTSLLDGRFSLYSSLDAGSDVLLFNEGDTSKAYTHALYVHSIAFTDRTMSAGEIAALGGPRAEGVFVRRLHATLGDGNLSLAWSAAANTRLQRATTLVPAAWEDVPDTLGASSHREPTADSGAFFRLVQP